MQALVLVTLSLRHQSAPSSHQSAPSRKSVPGLQSVPSRMRRRPIQKKQPCQRLRTQQQPSDNHSYAPSQATCSPGRVASRSCARLSSPSGEGASSGRSRRRLRCCRQRTPGCGQRSPTRWMRPTGCATRFLDKVLLISQIAFRKEAAILPGEDCIAIEQGENYDASFLQ